MSSDLRSVPEHIKKLLRPAVLEELRRSSSFDVFELELFDWYVNETEAVLQAMLAAEREAVKEQYDAGASSDEVNDSGIVAAEYYEKRVRYSHVIYLTSILETFLEGECRRLTAALGKQNIPFELNEINGDQWTKRRKFLERYGRFELSDRFRSAIDDLITLRNSIVHDNGEVSELTQQARNRLARLPGLNLNGLNVNVEAGGLSQCASLARLKGFFTWQNLGAMSLVGAALEKSTKGVT